MMAQMAMGQTLNHGKERVYTGHKETHWGKGNWNGIGSLLHSPTSCA
jgi:hypothetical protein